MKKTATLLSLILLAGGLGAVAQPVINSTVTYTVGGQLLSDGFNAQGVSPGNGGTNQTWNFASLQSTGQSVSVVVDVASTPYAASYPTANLCVKTGNLYAYSLNTATEISTLGAYNGQANIPYSNPEKNFKFPFSYQEVLTDSWQASFTTQGVPVTRYGQTKVTYDGYGTLTTPAGTFTDVARFKVEQDYYDVMAGIDTVFYVQTGYSWLKNGSRSLLALNELTYTVSGFSQTSYFGGYTPGNITLSVEEPVAAAALSIYPNPSAGEVTIESEGLRLVNLMSIDGKRIKSFSGSSSQTQLSLDLPVGLYIADCIYNDGSHASRRLVVQ